MLTVTPPTPAVLGNESKMKKLISMGFICGLFSKTFALKNVVVSKIFQRLSEHYWVPAEDIKNNV